MKAVICALLGFFLIECGAISLHGDEAREVEKIAERLLGEAQDVAEKEEERNNLATEKAFALVAVAFGWSDAGMKARADAAFGRVAARGQGFEALSRALLKTGRIEEALKNADKLISRERSDLLRDAIALLAKDGKVPAALAVLKSISISDSATLREGRELIAVAQFRSGNLAAALQMASDDTGRPGSALRQILAAQIAARDADGALQTFSCIHAAANTEHAMLIAEVAAIQVKGADWSAAYAWATRQTRPAPKAHALAGVARGLLKK